MTFAEYYHNLFRRDLLRIVEALPPLHDHGSDEVTLQPRTLSRANPVVRGWSAPRRMLFASGLFLTLLADQVFYTYFRAAYPHFRSLTQYPKWRGDCPGGCWWHAHPETIWRAISAKEGRLLDSLDEVHYSLLPDDLLTTMRTEVEEFAKLHLREIVTPEAYWAQCEREISPAFRLQFIASRPAAS